MMVVIIVIMMIIVMMVVMVRREPTETVPDSVRTFGRNGAEVTR